MWITSSDLSARLGSARYVELFDDDGNGTADAAAVAATIESAEGEFNSYAGRRYNLAALAVAAAADTTLAAVLRARCLDVAEIRSERRRPRAVPETVKQQYDEAVRWLRDVADGRVSLGSDALLTESASSAGQSGGATRVFTRDEMDGL